LKAPNNPEIRVVAFWNGTGRSFAASWHDGLPSAPNSRGGKCQPIDQAGNRTFVSDAAARARHPHGWIVKWEAAG